MGIPPRLAAIVVLLTLGCDTNPDGPTVPSSPTTDAVAPAPTPPTRGAKAIRKVWVPNRMETLGQP